MSTPRLEGKVAIVTGAASGIGAETVRLFAANGACIVAADIQDDLGQALVNSIGLHHRVTYFHCDVRHEDHVAAAVRHAVHKYGALHVMFSNAGVIGPTAGIMDLDMAGFDETVAVNVRGVAATFKHAAREMVARGTKGSLICTASVSGSVGGTGPGAYTASKHAVVGLVKAVCGELGAHGIRVNCVSPFGVGTPLACEAYGLSAAQVEERSEAAGNLKGIGLKASHIAQAVLFLASDDSAYISGHNLVVDGGYTVVARAE